MIGVFILELFQKVIKVDGSLIYKMIFVHILLGDVAIMRSVKGERSKRVVYSICCERL